MCVCAHAQKECAAPRKRVRNVGACIDVHPCVSADSSGSSDEADACRALGQQIVSG